MCEALKARWPFGKCVPLEQGGGHVVIRVTSARLHSSQAEDQPGPAAAAWNAAPSVARAMMKSPVTQQ